MCDMYIAVFTLHPPQAFVFFFRERDLETGSVDCESSSDGFPAPTQLIIIVSVYFRAGGWGRGRYTRQET